MTNFMGYIFIMQSQRYEYVFKPPLKRTRENRQKLAALPVPQKLRWPLASIRGSSLALDRIAQEVLDTFTGKRVK